jgi:hypothetical protein
MSKTIDLLNKIGTQRQGKYSFYAAHAKYNEPITKDVPQPRKKPKANKSKLWLIGAIFALFIALNFILSFTLFAMMHKYKSEAHHTFAGLNENIKKADSFADDIKQLGLDAKRLSKEAQGISATIKELSQKTDSQSFAIDNLTKAKNALFNKVSSLEVELQGSKTTN